MEKNKGFIVRNMKESDFEGVRDVWTAVDFVIFKFSNEIHFKLDQDGFFVAQDVATGKLLGVCSGLRLSTDLAFIGQYAVRPECHRKGIGTELWNKVMAHIGPDVNKSLFAAADMFPKYRNKSGFNIVSTECLHYFTGTFNCDKLIKAIEGITLDTINKDNIDKVSQYDKQITKFDRKLIIEGYTETNGNISAVALNHNQQVVGYCIVCVTITDALIISPLYADDHNIAEVLINKCRQQLPDNGEYNIIYYFWDSHPTAGNIAQKLCLSPMNIAEPVLFTRSAVECDRNKIFSVTNCTFWPF